MALTRGMMPGSDGTDAELALLLDALSSPVRIAILRALREPRSLSQIAISFTDQDGLRNVLLARQTVKKHINRLEDVGIVVSRTIEDRRRRSTQYVLNSHAVIGIMAAMERLTSSLANGAAPRGP